MNNMTEKKISLLVPTLGERINEITRLLDSIEQQHYPMVETVFVVQDNYSKLAAIIEKYDNLKIKQININERGLSYARNVGLDNIEGDIIVLSDDDCWYPKGALSAINSAFQKYKDIDILLTQIYDPVSKVNYKDYSNRQQKIKSVFKLLSKSSIEIAFKKEVGSKFDVEFGLGRKFIAGEEIDFLVNNYKMGYSIYYIPERTVYHQKKSARDNNYQIRAKGAFYCKNFGFLISCLILIRDLLVKRQNNIKVFFEGYNEYKKIHKRSN